MHIYSLERPGKLRTHPHPHNMTVELESTSASVENATFRTSDGAVDYKIDASGFKNRTTEITRHGQSVGRIVMHNFSSDEIIVNGTSIRLALKGKFTT